MLMFLHMIRLENGSGLVSSSVLVVYVPWVSSHQLQSTNTLHASISSSSAGIPNQYTGEPDLKTSKEADNCWVMAQHQWANEGCTAIHDRNDTIGGPVNDVGGGVYALEWDPENRHIKSWVFSPRDDMPQNLIEAIETASSEDASKRIMPDPHSWGLPYAYFAIGEETGCSADHFKNMRIVFNLAFCGNVSGNRFARECPTEAERYNVTNEFSGQLDPVETCNAYIEANPEALEEAYWKIKGVYVYERELEEKKKKPVVSDTTSNDNDGTEQS
jgi:hypothetical protein